jgi:NAD(P)-dependent dehydrogenase (short-subunit alcohol dehydrogenase family)|tara:strand:+ start:208 stop:897 length:690 start_codon:yes stop_codon:yes gene_type:complete
MMVSGANRGIGAALAQRFHADGWIVSLGARNVDGLRKSVEDWADDDVSCHRYDAFEPTTAIEWVQSTADSRGRVDGLTNNAGIGHMADLSDLSDELLDEMWAVNVKGPLGLIQATLPLLAVSGEGRIVNVVSLSGKRVKGTFAPGYAMSKHAMLALHHAVRHASFDDGIRVTAVCPGYVETDMTSSFGVDPQIMIQPTDLAETVATIVRLPNTATVAEILMTCEPEVLG